MTLNAPMIPSRLNVRLREDEKAAVAIVIAGISTPHRRPATVTEAIRAALTMAAAAVQQNRRERTHEQHHRARRKERSHGSR